MTEHERHLDEILGSYLRASDAGEPPDRPTLLARHPEHAAELRAFFADQDEVERLTMPLREVQAVPTPVNGVAELGQLGDFRLLHELGRGGMGIVYEAEQLSLNRRVALKILPFAAALDERHLQRFRHEAQAVAHLHHQHIVQVYSVGCERGVHFHAMQLIEGQTLAAVIEELRGLEGPERGLPRSTSGMTATLIARTTERSIRSPAFFQLAARLGVQAAEALEHAHAEGLVHRDVKPANLLVNGRGQLWITDFGLARFQNDAGLTRTGDLVGTLRYMSPEQALARHQLLDHRTDVYSLGTTLYELLTLQPAFAGRDREELLRQIEWDEPAALRRLNPAVPYELETVLHKAMAKDAAARYSTAQEFADDLRRFLTQEPIRARRPSLWERAARWMRRRQGLVAAALAVLVSAVLALVVASSLIWRAKEQTEAARAEAVRQSARADAWLLRHQETVDRLLAEVGDRWPAHTPHSEQVRHKLLLIARECYQELLRERGDEPALHHHAGLAQLVYGRIQDYLGQHAQAKAAYEQAVALLSKALEQEPTNTRLRHNLGIAHQRLGNLHLAAQQLPEAEQAQRRARAYLVQAAQAAPHEPSYQLSVAGNLNDLGVVVRHLRRPAEAEQLSREAEQLFTRLRAQYPDVADYRAGDATAQHSLALALLAQGRAAEAVTQYAQARDLWRDLSAELPAAGHFRYNLAMTHYNLANLYTRLEQPEEAQAGYDTARTLFAQLAQQYPRTPRYRQF